MAYISIGSNLGDREGNCRRSLSMIGAMGIKVRAVSRAYETRPWGMTDQPDFINMAAELETDMPPEVLHAKLHEIEDMMGRVRKEKWGPRNIDLDLLLYDDVVINTPGFTIPHPSILEREFVLAPLAEIAPDVLHPVLKKTARELLENLKRAG